MNHQVSQYRQLTSSIKTWMFEYKSPSKKEVLRRLISAYKGENRQSCNDTPVDSKIMEATKGGENQRITRSPLKSVTTRICNKCKSQKLNPYLKRDNQPGHDINRTITNSPSKISFKPTKRSTPVKEPKISNTSAVSELSFVTANESIPVKDQGDSPRISNTTTSELSFKTANESVFVEDQPPIIPERNYNKYPESIRHKIEFFETGVVPPRKILFESRRHGNNFEGGTVLFRNEKKKPPMVTETILKENIINQLKAIYEQSELRDEVKDLIPNPVQTPWESIQSAPTNDDQKDKFIVNLYNRKTSKNWPRVKAAVKGEITRINSKLYIQDAGKTETESSSLDDVITSAFDKTFSGETCILRNPNRDSDPDSSTSTISALLDKSEASTEDSLNEYIPQGTGFLEEEVHNQCRIMQEATKAVEMCSNIKELAGGKEQLEAERILLLAGLKRSLLLNKMREVQYGGQSKNPQSDGGARLTIKDLEFPLMLPEDHHEYQLWYIITCSCESILKASQLIPRKRFCHYLNFPDAFVFDNVDPNAMVSLKVYQVKIRNNLRTKRRLNKLCCFPQRTPFSRKSQKVQYKDSYSGMVVQSEVLPSIFTLCGSLEITMDRLLNNKNFLLTSTPDDSTLFGSLKLTAQVSNISINQTHLGFLTIGTEQKGNVVWDRKWCRLEGTSMRFWDHPSEEGLNKPKIIIELKNSIGDEVLDEYISRRRVLVVNVAGFEDEEDKTLVMDKYFLAADSSRDLKIWKKRLNSVLTSLRLWKCVDKNFDA